MLGSQSEEGSVLLTLTQENSVFIFYTVYLKVIPINIKYFKP